MKKTIVFLACCLLILSSSLFADASVNTRTAVTHHSQSSKGSIDINSHLSHYRYWRRHHDWWRWHHHHAKKECVQDNFGNQVCGYHCIKTSFAVACASKPDQACVADKMGDTACGYNCVKSAFKVACAKHKDQNCVMDSFGNVKCGKNCRISNMQIVCN